MKRTLLAYIVLACLVALFAWGVILSVHPVQAAPSEADECEPMGTAEGETLYLCEKFGKSCVWDPSTVLGAGVLDCE